MLHVTLALVLSSVVFDDADVLNASKRAELEVAAEDSTLVAVIDSARDAGVLEARVAELSRHATSVVVFDVATGCGRLVPFRRPTDPHGVRALERQQDLLCHGEGPWLERLTRATWFATTLGPPHPALAPPPPARVAPEAPDEPILGYVILLAVAVGAVARRARQRAWFRPWTSARGSSRIRFR